MKIYIKASQILLMSFLVFTLNVCWANATSESYYIYTNDSVSGLLPNAPVEFKGVDIGTVKKIILLNHDWVKIELNIQKEAVSRNTAVRINTRGLSDRGYTGYVFVELIDTKKRIQPLLPPNVKPENTFLPLVPGNSYGVDKELKEMSNDLDDITKLFNKTLDNKTMLSFKKLIENMEKLTTSLEHHDRELTHLLINLSDSSNELKPLFKSLQSMTYHVEQQFMPKMQSTMGKINLLSDSMLNLTDKLNRDPSIIIRGTKPIKPGPGED